MRVEYKLKRGFTLKLKTIISIIIMISAFATALAPSNISFLLFVRELYVLYNSFILDSGATVHICNNLAWFTDLYLVTEFILARDNIIPIKIYGTVIINYIILSGPTRVFFINIIYILEYHTNLILL